MTRREFAGTAAAAPAAPAPRPNIIFALARDLGYYGQIRIRTPSIDRLVAEGTRPAPEAPCAPHRATG